MEKGVLSGKGKETGITATTRGITVLSVPGKVLEHVLLMEIHCYLLKLQRSEQFGFKPGKSTTEHILVSW